MAKKRKHTSVKSRRRSHTKAVALRRKDVMMGGLVEGATELAGGATGVVLAAIAVNGIKKIFPQTEATGNKILRNVVSSGVVLVAAAFIPKSGRNHPNSFAKSVRMGANLACAANAVGVRLTKGLLNNL